jgi:hypothetical protein
MTSRQLQTDVCTSIIMAFLGAFVGPIRPKLNNTWKQLVGLAAAHDTCYSNLGLAAAHDMMHCILTLRSILISTCGSTQRLFDRFATHDLSVRRGSSSNSRYVRSSKHIIWWRYFQSHVPCSWSEDCHGIVNHNPRPMVREYFNPEINLWSEDFHGSCTRRFSC